MKRFLKLTSIIGKDIQCCQSSTASCKSIIYGVGEGITTSELRKEKCIEAERMEKGKDRQVSSSILLYTAVILMVMISQQKFC